MSTGRIKYNVLLLDDNSEHLEILKEELDHVSDNESRYEIRVFTVTKSTEVIEEAIGRDFDVYILDVARAANHKWQTGAYDYYGLDLYRLLIQEKPNILVKSRFFVYSKLPKDYVMTEFGDAGIDFYRKQDTSPEKMARIVKDHLDDLYEHAFSPANQTSVFVTYAWGPSGEEVNKYASEIRSFVEKLRRNSFDATFDLALFEEYDNWHTTMIEGLKRDKIIVVLSQEYKKKADRLENSIGSGVEFESSVLTQLIKKDPTRVLLVKLECFSGIPNDVITPICFSTGKNIIDLSDTSIMGGYNRLYARLSNKKVVEIAPVSGNKPKIKTIK